MATKSLFSPIIGPIFPVNPPNTATEGNDTINLWGSAQTTTSFDSLGGNDKIALNGPGNFDIVAGSGSDEVRLHGFGDATIDTGIGSDKVYIYGSGVATVDAGAGFDKVYVTRMEDHDLDGGANWDHLYFDGVGYALKIDMSSSSSGTAVQFNGWNNPTGNEVVDFQNFEYIHGTAHDDKFIGSSQGDRFFGGDGGDHLAGYDGNDYLSGEDGDDHAYAGNGDDTVFGGGGDDYMRGDAGDDRLFGQNGNDYMLGSDGADYMSGGSGNDRMTAGDGADTLYGGSGNDTIFSEAGSYEKDKADDVLSGGSGIDTLNYTNAKGGVSINADIGVVSGAGAGFEVISTYPFHVTAMYQDFISGFERYIGSDYDDWFRGKDYVTELEGFTGGQGDDRFKASAGIDVFAGDTGFDTVEYDLIGGWIDVDLQRGTIQAYGSEPGAMKWYDIVSDVEKVVGTNGQDIFKGDNRDNVFEGGQGHDLYIGRGGADVFEFHVNGPLGHDQITDFVSGEDIISLQGITMGAENWIVSDFSDLDTNGDGVLTEFDDAVSYIGSSLRIDFNGGSISLNNIFSLDAGDFMFV